MLQEIAAYGIAVLFTSTLIVVPIFILVYIYLLGSIIITMIKGKRKNVP